MSGETRQTEWKSGRGEKKRNIDMVEIDIFVTFMSIFDDEFSKMLFFLDFPSRCRIFRTVETEFRHNVFSRPFCRIS